MGPRKNKQRSLEKILKLESNREKKLRNQYRIEAKIKILKRSGETNTENREQ